MNTQGPIIMWWFHQNTIRVAHMDRDMYDHTLDPGKHALAKWVLPHSHDIDSVGRAAYSRSRAIGLKVRCALHETAGHFPVKWHVGVTQ